MKYKTLKELRKAYKSGELDRDADPLVLDNDCSMVYHNGERVYFGDMPEDTLRDALDLLNIPWEDA